MCVCAVACVCCGLGKNRLLYDSLTLMIRLLLSNHQHFVTFGILSNSSFGLGLEVEFAITRNLYLATIISSLLGMIGYFFGKCGWFTEDDLRSSCEHTLYGI